MPATVTDSSSPKDSRPASSSDVSPLAAPAPPPSGSLPSPRRPHWCRRSPRWRRPGRRFPRPCPRHGPGPCAPALLCLRSRRSRAADSAASAGASPPHRPASAPRRRRARKPVGPVLARSGTRRTHRALGTVATRGGRPRCGLHQLRARHRRGAGAGRGGRGGRTLPPSPTTGSPRRACTSRAAGRPDGRHRPGSAPSPPRRPWSVAAPPPTGAGAGDPVSAPGGGVAGLLAVRGVRPEVVQLPAGQAVPDHLEGQEMLPLLAEHPAQPLHVVVEELAVARRRTLGVDQALALEEADLRDGDVGELLPEQRQDVADGEVGAAAHSFPATR